MKKYQDYIALLCFAGAIALLVWKAYQGFGFWDESWYITFAHRYILGDAMVADDWHVSQFLTVLLYLPVRIYISVAGSTEGIILFFRYLTIAFLGTTSAAIYVLMRKYGPISIAALLVFFLHIPAGLMALNYYSLAMCPCAVIGLLLSKNQFKKPVLIIIGLLFACAVLANPFLAIVYFVYLLAVIVVAIHQGKDKNKPKSHEGFLSIKTWLWITLGIAAVACVTITVMFSKTTIREFLVNLPNLFEDSEYSLLNTDGKKQNIINIRQSIFEIANINPYLFTAYGATLLAITIDKKRIIHRLHYLIASSAIVAAYIIYLASTGNYYKYILCMFPLTLLGLVSYILCSNKNKYIFYFVWLWGVIVAVFEDVASNWGTNFMSVGLATSVLASIVFIKNLLDEIKNSGQSDLTKQKNNRFVDFEKKLAAILLVAVLLFQIGFECLILTDTKAMSAEYLYHDEMKIEPVTEKLNVTIQKGPQKGVVTTETSAEIYYNMLIDLTFIKDHAEGPVLIFGEYPWAYLYIGKPYATYGTWYLIWEFEETMGRLSQYYELHPDKIPEYIYIPDNFTQFISDEFWANASEQYSINHPAEALEYIKNQYHCDITEGQAGYIIKVLN